MASFESDAPEVQCVDTSATARSRWRLAVTWRLVSYWGGVDISAALALLSPIDALGQQLFFMHMIQHLLLIMIAPPLLLIANPMPFLLWGLPTGLRRQCRWCCLARHCIENLVFGNGCERLLTQPGIVWMLWVISLIGWHDPGMYNAALRYEWLHDVEHLTFFIAKCFVVVASDRELGRAFTNSLACWAALDLVISVIPPNMMTGVVLCFCRARVLLLL